MYAIDKSYQFYKLNSLHFLLRLKIRYIIYVSLFYKSNDFRFYRRTINIFRSYTIFCEKSCERIYSIALNIFYTKHSLKSSKSKFHSRDRLGNYVSGARPTSTRYGARPTSRRRNRSNAYCCKCRCCTCVNSCNSATHICSIRRA